jgi:hypothetical protein
MTVRRMKIVFTKQQARGRLTCHRPDGSATTADVGPRLPHHDLAHYVVESHWRLRLGFYGHIARGRSLAELSDKDVIATLGPEAYLAEVLTRALQALSSGACLCGQFAELVNAELGSRAIPAPTGLDADAAGELLDQFRSLLQRYETLAAGESLSLEFSFDS